MAFGDDFNVEGDRNSDRTTHARTKYSLQCSNCEQDKCKHGTDWDAVHFVARTKRAFFRHLQMPCMHLWYQFIDYLCCAAKKKLAKNCTFINEIQLDFSIWLSIKCHFSSKFHLKMFTKKIAHFRRQFDAFPFTWYRKRGNSRTP